MAATSNTEPIVEDVRTNGSEPAQKIIEQMMGRLGTNVAFGEPVRIDNTTIISVAEVRSGFGFGFGRGRHVKHAEPADTGEGRGGGGGGKITPLGYINIRNDKAWFEPVYNINKIVLAGIGFSSLLVLMIARLLKD